MTAALVLAAVAAGAVAATLLHRIAAELCRATVVCADHTRRWDPDRREWVHHVDPAAQLRTALIGPPRRPPHVERSRR